MNYSYAMGVSKNIKELTRYDFIIKEDDGDYTVMFPKGKEDIWEEYIKENIKNEYWNEYIGDKIVFMFKFSDGSLKKYVLDENNTDEILKLCSEFADTEFTSMEDMIFGNEFYKEQIEKLPV